jgi:hypothetical protein
LAKSSIAVNASGSNAAAAMRDAKSSRQLSALTMLHRVIFSPHQDSHTARAPATQKVAGMEMGVLTKE